MPRTHFAHVVLLRWSVFSAEADFENARFDDAVNLARVEFHQAAHSWPAGWRTEPEPGTDWLLVLDGLPA